jgi:hypothetical protein
MHSNVSHRQPLRVLLPDFHGEMKQVFDMFYLLLTQIHCKKEQAAQ